MGEWKEYKWGDLATLEYGKGLRDYLRIDGKYPVFGTNGKIGTTDSFLCPHPSIIIGRKGAYRGVHFSSTPFYVIDTAFYLKPKTNHLDMRFAYYHLLTVDINYMDSGSAIPSTSRDDFYDLDILLPSLTKQKSIASILSSLDDKLDLLHRQNKTLEALAETLFRQWFVEEAEEGWEIKSLFDVIELVGGGTPKTEVAEYWNGNIKWISAKDITPNHKGFITETEKAITELGLENSSAKLMPRYATVISARGTVGKYCLLAKDMAFSQSNYGIKPRYKDCYFFTYLLVASSVDQLQAAAYGSVFDTITTNTFKEHKINAPKEAEIMSFEESIKPYFEKMLRNYEQIRTLTRLRDTLLPKLMSGEVRVKLPLTPSLTKEGEREIRG